MRKDMLRVRLTREEREAFIAAAKREGMTLSAWLRLLARREAKKTAVPA